MRVGKKRNSRWRGYTLGQTSDGRWLVLWENGWRTWTDTHAAADLSVKK